MARLGRGLPIKAEIAQSRFLAGPGWRVSAAVGVSTTTTVIQTPSEVLDGSPFDSNTLLVLWVATTQTATVTTPSGWTIVGAALDGGTGVRQYVFYKVATAGVDEGVQVSVSLSAADKDVSVIMLAVDGVNVAAPVTANFTKSGTGVSTLTGPTLSGIGATDIVLEGASARPDGATNLTYSVTPPATWTNTGTVNSAFSDQSTFPSVEGVIWKVNGTDSPTWTFSGNSEIAIKALQLAAAVSGVTVSPVGIPSGQSMGDTDVAYNPTPMGCGSSETLGSPALTTTITVAPASRPTEETFGAPTVATSLSPIGIADGSGIGVPAVTSTYTVAPSAIATAERAGNPAVQVVVTPTAIDTAERLGAPAVSATYTLSPAGISALEGFGTTSITQSVSPYGVPTGERSGVPTVFVAQTVQPVGVTSGELPGGVVVAATYTVSPVGLRTLETAGTPNVSQAITPVGVGTSERAGSTTVSVVVAANPVGIPTQEAIGAPQVSPGAVTMAPAGIRTQEAFSPPTISVAVSVNPVGISTTERSGNPALTPGAVTVSPAGVPADVQVSPVFITAERTLFVNSAPPSERCGFPAVNAVVTLLPASAGGSERFGALSLIINQLLAVRGISTAERFGNYGLTQQDLAITPILVYQTEQVTTARGDPNIVVSKIDEAHLSQADILLLVYDPPEIIVRKE